jgi:hypothetical protein
MMASGSSACAHPWSIAPDKGLCTLGGIFALFSRSLRSGILKVIMAREARSSTLTRYSACVSRASVSDLSVEHTGRQVFDVANMIQGLLLCEELFDDAVGFARVHMENTLHFVHGVEANTSTLINIKTNSPYVELLARSGSICSGRSDKSGRSCSSSMVRRTLGGSIVYI